MATAELKSLLTQLHENLAATDQVDPELKSLLADLDAEIRKLLGTSDSAGASSLVERLQDARTDFAVNHPQIAGLLGRLADGLAQLGI